MFLPPSQRPFRIVDLRLNDSHSEVDALRAHGVRVTRPVIIQQPDAVTAQPMVVLEQPQQMVNVEPQKYQTDKFE